MCFLLMNECVIEESFYVVRVRYEPCYMCFLLMNECCLFRCHSMLFVLVMSRLLHVSFFCSRYERVCNCLFRCHSMLFVLVMSRVTCVLLMNKCVIVYSGVILCCSARYEPCYMCVIVYSGVILCCSCSL